MNFDKILNEIEKVDPEVYGRLDTRRAAMKGFANLGSKLALAAVPLALGSMFNKAYAGTKSTKDTVVAVLNYALTLEYLEAEFYTTAISKGTALIPAGASASAIATISGHETAHVKFLQGAIAPMGTVVAKPTFDFSGGSGSGTGPFMTAFIDYALFLAVAQTLEDTGVRAYKGRAAELVKGGDLLTAALNIHSVEARHASHIRQMRKAAGIDIKPWITGVFSGVTPASLVAANYLGEDNTTQAGTIAITNINGTSVSANAASEAFDEPLAAADVLAIVKVFIKA